MSMLSRTALALGTLLAAHTAGAANAPFQDFFFNVCANASGALAQRCAETPNGLGDLSGDSESSLNPSQALGHGRVQIDGIRARTDGLPGETAVIEAADFTLRISAHGSRMERDRGDTLAEERGLDGDGRDFDIGLDYRLSERTVIGALLGLSRHDYDFVAEAPGNNFTPQRRAGSADIDSTQFSLFASFTLGDDGYLFLSGGYGWTEGEYQRTSVFQESTRSLTQRNTDLRGDADGSLRWLSLDMGRDFVRDELGFGYYGGLTWARSSIDGYSEQDLSGSGLAMRLEGIGRSSLQGVLGATLSRTISGRAGVFVPQLRAQWQHEFDDDAEAIEASYLLDPAATRFRLQGERPDRGSGEIGLSLTGILGGGWSVYADYARLFSRDDLRRDRLSLGLLREF
ncbi:MAG: autotransporter outer membrane beta-barrel domain-containing protein [Lysobacteraceae bacterium]